MKCEEFEAIGLEIPREAALRNAGDSDNRAAVLEHAKSCSRCAALLESWQEARLALRALGEATKQSAPARVEMRVRQEFRTKHSTGRVRGRLIFAAWTLATAAVLIVFVSWWNWRVTNNGPQGPAATSAPTKVPARDFGNANGGAPDRDLSDATLVADNEGDFTLLPGSLPQETQDAAILRVRLQRGALGAMGLPVNAERAGDWIQVDLLVGEDGQPRAVRLPVGESD